tara:strand:+ start:55 stop:822 length:768 start_codon:yes stop_codon:yes gene_type:complete
MLKSERQVKDKFIAGGISGIIEVISTHPIDLIKTKLQEASQKKMVINDQKIFFYNKYKLYGMSYMYSGLFPRILGIVPMRFIFWGVQGTSNEYLKQYNMIDKNRLILSGIIGGTAQTLVDNPIETMKIQQMTSTTNSYKLSKNILFSGFKPTLARNVLFAAILNYTVNISPSSENYGTHFLKGAAGGFIGSVITQPLDYIKTEQQRCIMNNRSIMDIIIKDHKFFMVGTLPRAILGFLNMGIGVSVYNILLKHFL